MAKLSRKLPKYLRQKKTQIQLAVLAALLFVAYLFYGLPDIGNVKPLETKPGITILANDGTLIARYGNTQGQILSMKDIPPYLVAAVLSVEDRRFYSHFGIDPLGMLRAVVTNLIHGHVVQGGSTLTQQLAKNLFLTPDKTLRRKFQEALLALEIEHLYSKDDILLAYLNRVYFGAGAYGIDAASKTYFKKPASELSIFESAVLAGMLKAPTRFSPSANPALAKERGKVVIREMEEAGYLTKARADEEIKNAHFRITGALAGDLNHYFTDWVIDQIDSFITTTDSDLTVRTTLDPKLQLMAEAKQRAIFKKIKPEDKVSEAAMVTESPDGAILAMTGGVDYKASQFNRAVQAKRQPGSSFKPFVYLAALESGLSPDTEIEDTPLREGTYRPDNYEGKYYGTVTLQEALSKSLNAATIRLAKQVGIDKVLDVTNRMGFTSELKRELATCLGADEVTLLELTNAYSIINNGGRRVWPYAVLSIKDAHGNMLYQHEEVEHPLVFATSNLRDLDKMMEQVVIDGTGKAAKLSHGHTAGKTGTTEDYRDALFMGYSDNLITGVWMGNDDNSEMHNVTGGKYPAQLWHDYMEAAIDFEVPVFKPEPMSAPAGGASFSELLSRWASGVPAPPQEENKKNQPVYNK